MTKGEIGPGVRRFAEAGARGDRADLADIARDHPDEALALADAARRMAAAAESMARERMWLARATVLRDAGEDVTLGTMLRSARSARGFTTSALLAALRERGVEMHPMAIGPLEANRVTVTNIDPTTWSAIADALQLDPHRVVVGIGMAISAPQANRTFTRMERGATASDREHFLGEVAPSGSDAPAVDYLERVREALGLPSALSDTTQ